MLITEIGLTYMILIGYHVSHRQEGQFKLTFKKIMTDFYVIKHVTVLKY